MTDDDIRKEVYSETFQEYSDNIESFIQGMIYMRDKYLKAEQSKDDENKKCNMRKRWDSCPDNVNKISCYKCIGYF